MKSRVARLIQRVKEVEVETRETAKGEGGGGGLEGKIVEWAFEKLVLDIKLMLLGEG